MNKDTSVHNQIEDSKGKVEISAKNNVRKLPFKLKVNIFFLILIIIAFISYLIYIFLINPPKPERSFQTVSLSSFERKYLVNDNFNLVNELTIDTSKDNFYFQSSDTNYSSIKDAALKLGMSVESVNQRTKVRVFTPQGVNSLSDKFIKIDEDLNTVSLNYSTGINQNNLKIDEVYEYLKSLFNLPDFTIEVFDRDIENVDNYYISYRIKFDDKNVYFNTLESEYLQVYVRNGKIVELYFYYFPSDYKRKSELKPIEKINKDTLSNKYYKAEFLPQNFFSSESGIEQNFTFPIQVNLIKYETAYFYYKDTVNGNTLLPIIVATGSFTDQNLIRGEANLLVINQN